MGDITQSNAGPRGKVIGAIMLGCGLLWLGWVVLFQHGDVAATVSWIYAGVVPSASFQGQIAPLLAEGITLSQAEQQPVISKQQALLIAGQHEPDAAAGAQGIDSRYVTANYSGAGSSGVHPNLNNAQVWMIWYKTIAVDAGGNSASSHYDLFVFIDANNGKELLSILV